MDFNDLKNKIDALSLLANILTIIGFITTLNIFFKFIKNLLWYRVVGFYYKNKYHSLTEFVKENEFDDKNIDLKRMKILVLDDELHEYPISYLRSIGFNIVEKENISFSDVDTLLEYDIIILDITGVVKEDPKDGGFRVLKKLREKENHQIIIAASSKLFDFNMSEFFELADKSIKKPMTEIELEETIKQVVEDNLHAERIAKFIDEELQKEFSSTKYRCFLSKLGLYLNRYVDEAYLKENVFKNNNQLKNRIYDKILILRK